MGKVLSISIFKGGAGKTATAVAGKMSQGGVYYLNHRLHIVHELALADPDQNGLRQYRFIGLYDNDKAGRNAMREANRFNRRLIPFLNLFLLHPVMPLGFGENDRLLRARFYEQNRLYRNMDWEIEDLLSESLIANFANGCPQDVRCAQQVRGRKHWEFSGNGKQQLRRYANVHATLDDMWDAIALLCALRSYFRLTFHHIACNIPTR